VPSLQQEGLKFIFETRKKIYKKCNPTLKLKKLGSSNPMLFAENISNSSAL